MARAVRLGRNLLGRPGGIPPGIPGLDLQIVCAKCSAEFTALADDPKWACPTCAHEIENVRYPFLTRRVAHAKAHRKETDWETMFDEVLAAAHEKVLALEARIHRLESENRRLTGGPPKGD